MGAGDSWRALVEKLQRRVDRLTHSGDRRRALRRARKRARPRQVLLICYGNICRSPYAEVALRMRLASAGVTDVSIDSSGFYGPGRPANDQGARIAAATGIDLSRHRSKLVTQDSLNHSDLVLAMTHEQRRQLIRQFGVAPAKVELLGDFDTDDPPEREIVDPYGRPDADFLRAFAQIDRSLEGFCRSFISLPLTDKDS